MVQLTSLIFVALVIIPFSPWEDTHWPKWMMLHIVLAVYLGLRYFLKYNLALGVLVFTTIYSGAMIFVNRETYTELHQVLRIDMSNMSAKAVVAFLLLIMFLEFVSLDILRRIVRSFVIMCVFHCIYVLVQRYFFGIDRDHATGFLPNVSMGPSMLAILYPTLFSWTGKFEYKLENFIRLLGVVLFPILIWIEGSSISWAAFIAGIVGLTFVKLKDHFGIKKALSFASVISVGGFLLGSCVDNNWYHPEKVSRFTIWPKFLGWWWNHKSIWFGAGTGAFRHLGPNLQQQFNFEVGQWWYWAHSEFVQIPFEIGLVGAVSAAALWAQCVIWSYRKGNIGMIGALSALLIVAFGNYPIRLAEYCLLTSVLLAIPVKENEKILSVI